MEARLVVAAPHEVASKPPGDEVSPITADPAPAERPLIALLGPLTIHGAKQSRRGLRARALELIAFLALRREGAQRDEILEALWPGEDPRRSRHRLYQAVRDARRLLGDAVSSERDRYWLERDRVRVDVDELDELVDKARRARRDTRAELLERALMLFRGEPLAGCDYVWSEGELRRLGATYVELLKRVGRARLERGDPQASLAAAERGLVVDALDEDLWRLALEAEGALGLREAIDERYGRLRDLLHERLALEPAKETRALYLRLLGQG
ncbi:MAG TPA: BTAD domain-containing putative transcriptional regulator [Gaiellaceae bacterium]|nr:BTAD domain-containing putative transcriptional regulator [Gaiellaceae bacterium]